MALCNLAKTLALAAVSLDGGIVQHQRIAAHSEVSIPANQAASSRERPHASWVFSMQVPKSRPQDWRVARWSLSRT